MAGIAVAEGVAVVASFSLATPDPLVVLGETVAAVAAAMVVAVVVNHIVLVFFGRYVRRSSPFRGIRK